MTTLVLGAADAALGSLVGSATGLVGTAITGALGGGAGRTTRLVEGPRLSEMGGLASTEGAPIPRVYGRVRIGGQLIWATRFEEVANTTVQRSASSGGKSLGGSTKAATTTVTTSYSYRANLAVGLCEGPIAFVRRIWADGQELDRTTLTVRVHRGGEDQPPDPLIVAKEGAENAPGYRGLAYVVFERLPLGPFGNRVPQFSFEVVRTVGGLPEMIRSVCLIPGATEFGYDTVPVVRTLGLGASAPENTHQFQSTTDLDASLDVLGALCPNLGAVSLVVTWFGDDVRAGACTVRPCVDRAGKATAGAEWAVAGLTRSSARTVSQVGDASAYGGTPSDAGVVRAVAALKARGVAVTLYPFVMMDVPAGNALPNPYTGEPGQAPYPWRGRVTCDPAPGMPGTVDGSGTAAAQVAAFFGSATSSDYAVEGSGVRYSGPEEWGFRRLVLHYAHLAVAAGGVDAFVLGSELVGLTRVRGGSGEYPAVGQLRALATDLRSVLGAGTRIVYAADWTEYGAHVREGGAELRFPLDPLWADPAVDAVGIDYYPPVSDWRDGTAHADLAAAGSAADLAYLRDRLGSGEAFDWFYASDADREGQVRTPITDGAYGKPWAYRAKDLVGWWSSAHVERTGGVETSPTAWVPGSKPIWLTELGIPAVDKGANGPNVFPDPKSSESAYPPFSAGTRDDLVQARGLEAILSRFDPALPGFEATFNPVATTYGGRMVDPARLSVWAWDARPFPAFPDFDLVWADGANWRTGHWITGRLEGVPLDRLVAAIQADFGLDPGPRPALDGFLDGYVVDRPLSARAALEPLGRLFGFDAVASADGLRWRGRGGRTDATILSADLVEAGDEPVIARRRAQETDLPGSMRFGFLDPDRDFARASVASRRLAGASRREEAEDFAAVAPRATVQRLADVALQDAWAGREDVELRLSPRALEFEPGDVVSVETPVGRRLHRVTRIVDGEARHVFAQAVEPAAFAGEAGQGGNTRSVRRRPLPSVRGPAEPIVLTLPAGSAAPAPLQYLAVAADPWPGAVAVWRAADDASFSLLRLVDWPATIGRTLDPCPPGPAWRWDDATRLTVEVSAPAISSIGDMAALAGGNLLAVEGPDGRWEVLSAATAETVGARRYRLSRFLRGLGGTEGCAARPVPAGARIVVLDEAVVPLTSDPSDLGRAWTYRIGPADRDHADPSYVEVKAAVDGLALAPLAPVHVQARRQPDGIRIGWVRRTRVGGDPWEIAEVPLGEDDERYEVDILAGSAVRRTLSAGSPSVLYGAADEIADFGAPQTALNLRVVQLSTTIGRGEPAVAHLTVL